MTDYHTAMVPRGKEARDQLSRWHELHAGHPEAQITYRDYIVGGLYTIANWQRGGSTVLLEQLKAALLHPVFAPFAGRACCSFGLPFDPQIVEADDIVAALAQRRPVRPEVSSILRLKMQPVVEVVADEDSGLSGGRIEHRMDGYAGLRAWRNRKQIVTEIING
jgi:hypothetical protein